MRGVAIGIGMVAWSLSAAAQPAPSRPPAEPPPAIVRQWIERLNALSDQPATLDAFVALYTTDALHATYRGHDGIRVLAARIAASEERRVYRLETETARETTTSLMHETAGPWGGPAVAVQIIATYTDAVLKKRFAAPGAVFLQIADGRIRRARVYISESERAEVEPEPTRRRP
jgi:ketosteroid isomerase-like protein